MISFQCHQAHVVIASGGGGGAALWGAGQGRLQAEEAWLGHLALGMEGPVQRHGYGQPGCGSRSGSI